MAQAKGAQAKGRAAATKEAMALPDGLTPEGLLELYATMVLVRTLDERVWAMNRQGKAVIVSSCQGHEAAQRPDDQKHVRPREQRCRWQLDCHRRR